MSSRRQFITLFGGAAAAWPVAARAQQPPRRVGALMDTNDNPDGQGRYAAFRRGLQDLGWTEGRNIQIDVRWGGGDVTRIRAYAAELVALKPAVIFAFANAQLAPLSRETRTIPIVFVGASEPGRRGLCRELCATGGQHHRLYPVRSIDGWHELKQIAPAIARVGLLVNPDTAVLRGTLYSREFAAAATKLKVEPVTLIAHDAAEIEAAITGLAHGGLIVVPDTFSNAHRELIIALAARLQVPAIYGQRQFPMTGGLLSYGPDLADTTYRSASYVDRILRGEMAAELPIQAPTKFEMVVNLKAAKTLGLILPEPFLLRADEVIE
jgi:putative tryptophan/tyrosine transport system substrate-binding protein